jgi:hypothetical protein
MSRPSRLVCSVLLRFYPVWYRVEWGDELEVAMRACVARERRRLGTLGVAYAWIGLALDAFCAGTRLRLEAFGHGRRPHAGIAAKNPKGTTIGDVLQSANARTAPQTVRPALVRDVFGDIRYGIRGLRRSPAFALVAGVTLALGIGAATAVFSVVNGVLIKPLPYPDPEALVSIWNASRVADGSGQVPLSATQFFTYRDGNRTFAALGLWSSGMATVTGSFEPEEVRTLQVTDGALQALGVQPAIGRWFSRDDDAPGSPESVMLAHAFGSGATAASCRSLAAR